MTQMKNPSRVLVIQPLPGIGDTLWFLPHLKVLGDFYKEAHMSLLTKLSSKADEVLEGQLPLEKILWLHRETEHAGLGGVFRLASLLKKEKFDAVWVLHKSPRYALAAWLAGIPRIYGYGLSYGRYFVQPPTLTREERSVHPIQQAEALLRHHGLGDRLSSYGLTVPLEQQSAIQKRYALRKDTNGLVLGIGGSEPYKKWPTASFAQLALRLGAKGYKVFVLGGMKEKEEALTIQSLVEKEGGTVVPVFDLSLQASFALLSQMRYFVGNDTSMLNAAALLGVQTIGIFAKTPPLSYRLNLHPFVSKGTHPSIDQVTVEEIWHYFEGLTGSVL